MTATGIRLSLVDGSSSVAQHPAAIQNALKNYWAPVHVDKPGDDEKAGKFLIDVQKGTIILLTLLVLNHLVKMISGTWLCEPSIQLVVRMGCLMQPTSPTASSQLKSCTILFLTLLLFPPLLTSLLSVNN